VYEVKLEVISMDLWLLGWVGCERVPGVVGGASTARVSVLIQGYAGAATGTWPAALAAY
jgi:hypothetical protein